jgi:hypothetical protein
MTHSLDKLLLKKELVNQYFYFIALKVHLFFSHMTEIIKIHLTYTIGAAEGEMQ